jgi:arabinoxylan arabinofuranohydrolase
MEMAGDESPLENIDMDHLFCAVKNPIIPNLGICDPHMHVFNSRVYLYASHDHHRAQTNYCMKDWHIWSSDDLVNWQFERAISPSDMYMGESDDCWATDAAFGNGKYYFYFSNGNKQTGVAISDHPAGPYRDALGKPLLDGSMTTTREYDPAVFIDDDPEQTPYIIFGGPAWAYGEGAGYFIARLNNDMISLAESPRPLQVNHEADGKASLHKHNGVYYLSWASFYAVSNSVYGPYRYIGNFGASPDHGSFFSYNNQDFNAFTIFDPSMQYRATGLCYVHYRDNGHIAVDQLITEFGVGQYNAQWNRIEAEWYMSAQGITKRENPRQGFDAVASGQNSWLYYPNIHNLPKNSSISLFAASDNPSPVVVEVREDDPHGTLLGEVTISTSRNTNWMGYRTTIAQLSNNPGDINLYFVFKGLESGHIYLDWFCLFI